MRQFAENKWLRISAIAGTRVVFITFDFSGQRSKRVLLGFALRRDKPGQSSGVWLHNPHTHFGSAQQEYVTAAKSVITSGKCNSVPNHVLSSPIQDFRWIDDKIEPDHSYSYTLVPIYRAASVVNETKIVPVAEFSESLQVRVQSEPEVDAGDGNEIYFNSGTSGSQEYTRKFLLSSSGKSEIDPSPVCDSQLQWLSRGLDQAFLSFVDKAQGPNHSLLACFYECCYKPGLKALSRARDRGVYVRFIHDAGTHAPIDNDAAIRECGVEDIAIPRRRCRGISHNKFVLLVHLNRPIAVWTGSTNLKKSAWFGQANVGHVCRDPGVLQSYLVYWRTLSTDPCIQELKRFNSEQAALHCRSFWSRRQQLHAQKLNKKQVKRRAKKIEAKKRKQQQMALRQRLQADFERMTMVGRLLAWSVSRLTVTWLMGG